MLHDLNINKFSYIMNNYYMPFVSFALFFAFVCFLFFIFLLFFLILIDASMNSLINFFFLLFGFTIILLIP
jgi:hypothetical protein